MAKGRSFRSSSKSLMALSSSLGADPGLFFGARDSPLWALSAYRLSEERLTEKVLAPEPWTCRLLPRRLSSAVGLPSNRSCDHVLIGSLSLQRAVIGDSHRATLFRGSAASGSPASEHEVDQVGALRAQT